MFDIVSFYGLFINKVYLSYFFKIHRHLVLYPPIRCIFFSFIFFFSFFFKVPKLQDIPNRRKIDLYRLVGYPILF